ncbi:MAG: hypothetical protein ACXWP5_14455 [Bdellovibrionota bacterium]
MNESHFRFGSVFTGALITLALQAFLALFGIAFFLSRYAVELGQLPSSRLWIVAAIGAAALVAGTNFFGGFVASALTKANNRTTQVFQGLGVWATVVCFVLFFGSATFISPLTSFGAKAGVLSAGGATGISAVLRELKQLHPVLVSDLHLFKGKIVSSVEMDLPGTSPKKLAKGSVKRTKAEIKKIAEDPETRASRIKFIRQTREIGGWSALGGLVLLLVGAVCSLLGALAFRAAPAPRVAAARREPGPRAAA